MKYTHNMKNAALKLQLQKLSNNIEIKARYNCMHPLIQPNSIVTIIPINNKTISVGDIVLIDQGYRFVIHRILKCYRKTNMFLTAGDNSVIYDDKIHISSILGIALKATNLSCTAKLTKKKTIQKIVAICSYFYISMQNSDNKIIVTFKLAKLINRTRKFFKKLLC